MSPKWKTINSSYQENLEQRQKYQEPENNDLYKSGAYEDKIPKENQ